MSPSPSLGYTRVLSRVLPHRLAKRESGSAGFKGQEFHEAFHGATLPPVQKSAIIVGEVRKLLVHPTETGTPKLSLSLSLSMLPVGIPLSSRVSDELLYGTRAVRAREPRGSLFHPRTGRRLLFYSRNCHAVFVSAIPVTCYNNRFPVFTVIVVLHRGYVTVAFSSYRNSKLRRELSRTMFSRSIWERNFRKCINIVTNV